MESPVWLHSVICPIGLGYGYGCRGVVLTPVTANWAACRRSARRIWLASTAFCKWIPRFATQPTSSLLFFHRAVSVVRFHCQLLDWFALGSSPWCGLPPKEAPKTQPCVAQMAWFPPEKLLRGPSSVLTAPVPTPKGVLFERMLMASSRSRE